LAMGHLALGLLLRIGPRPDNAHGAAVLRCVLA